VAMAVVARSWAAARRVSMVSPFHDGMWTR
jgi:hypothetical protein